MRAYKTYRQTKTAQIFKFALEQSSSCIIGILRWYNFGMLTAYEAILHGDFLEWRQDVPQQAAADQSVNVHVTFLETTTVENKGPQMAEALSKLARSRNLNVVDALAWERETRSDKTLEGRNE